MPCPLPVAVVCAVAELLQLTSLQLLHGELQPGLDISHWSSLRRLAELKLLPGEEAGLRDEQVGCLSGKSESVRQGNFTRQQ
jgi:hypothetical protein